MSSLNIKQGSDAHFSEYPLASPSNNEIDLLNLIAVLWRAKKTVMAVIFLFSLAGVLIFFFPPQKKKTPAGVTPPHTPQGAQAGENIPQPSGVELGYKKDS
nr:Wzz/FepE/Etk N-terminal domain-containing protein [Escherichia coli]